MVDPVKTERKTSVPQQDKLRQQGLWPAACALADRRRGLLWLAVFVGGALGTLLRSLVGQTVLTYLIVPNLAACFLMGASSCALLHTKLPALYRQAVNAGFLGGLSTYASPVVVLLDHGNLTARGLVILCAELLAYLVISILGYAAVALYFRRRRQLNASMREG